MLFEFRLSGSERTRCLVQNVFACFAVTRSLTPLRPLLESRRVLRVLPTKSTTRAVNNLQIRRLIYGKSIESGEIRLFVRQQKGRRQRHHEAAARRQGREPGGNDPHRPAGAARVHHHHRGLHLLLREQAHLSQGTARRRSKRGVAIMEKIMGKKFGDMQKPLLVSVRSGARDSMPGMMDTILNLGLNDQTVLALVNATQQ